MWKYLHEGQDTPGQLPVSNCWNAVSLSVQINAADAVLIFDEAHNIEDQARCA
jgi:Rad3-related DNA helicase